MSEHPKIPVPPKKPEPKSEPKKDSDLTEVKPRSTLEINPGRYNEDLPEKPDEPTDLPEPKKQ